MAREMKDSGVEWIGCIPYNWTLSKNKYLLDGMYSGGTPTASNEQYYSEDGTPFVSISDMSTVDYVINTKKRVTQEGIKDKNLEVLPVGTILYSIYATIGSVAELKIPATISQAMLALRLKSTVDKRYYKYSLNAMRDYIFFSANGNTQFNLNAEKVWNFWFVHPPLFEQIIISDYLDTQCSRIDAVIEKTRASIEEYKKLKQAVITQAVTKGIRPGRDMKDSGVEWIGEIPSNWTTRPLKAFIDILPGYAFSSNDFDSEAGIPLLRGINVAPNAIRWDETVRWNQPVTEQLRQYELRENDLVLGLDRPWISEGTRVAFVSAKDLPCLLLQRVCRIRSKDSMDIRFVYHVIAGKTFEEALSTDTTGVSVPHISTKQVENYIIAVPSFQEQVEICDYLEEKNNSIDELITQKKRILLEMENYKKT